MSLIDLEISTGFLKENDKNHYIYRHIRLDKNEPFYIGQGKYLLKTGGKKGIYFRARVTHKLNNIWKSITDKTDYKVEILFDNLTKEEVNIKEIELIKLYGKIFNNTGILANFTDGGEGSSGFIPTAETRKKMSETQKKRVFTTEHRERISIANTGRKFSEERKQQMSDITKKYLEENIHPMLGKTHTVEVKNRLSEYGKLRTYGKANVTKKVIDTSTGKIYSCIKEVSDLFGKNYGTVKDWLSGRNHNPTSFILLDDYPY